MVSGIRRKRSLIARLECQNCPTRSLAEWSALNDDDMGAVEEARTARTFQRGQVLFAQSQPATGIYCIHTGAVALTKQSESSEQTYVRLAHAGQTFGYPNMLNAMVCTTSAKALGRATICHVEVQPLRAILRRRPALERRFNLHMAEDLDETERHLVQLASLPVRSRLARLLVDLSDRYAHPENGSTVMTPPMTWRDMSELLCTRPETLTRTIHAMQEDGVFNQKGHLLSIPDMDVLRGETHPQ